MKLKKNVNLNSLVERLKQVQQEANILANHFQQAATLFNDTKFGIEALDYKIDEDLARYFGTCERIENMVKEL